MKKSSAVRDSGSFWSYCGTVHMKSFSCVQFWARGMECGSFYECFGNRLLSTQAFGHSSSAGAVGPRQCHGLRRLARHHHVFMKMLFEDRGGTRGTTTTRRRPRPARILRRRGSGRWRGTRKAQQHQTNLKTRSLPTSSLALWRPLQLSRSPLQTLGPQPHGGRQRREDTRLHHPHSRAMRGSN